MKKFFVVVTAILLAGGIFLMGYSAEPAFDVAGLCTMVAGAGIGTAITVKTRKGKKPVQWILPLVLLWIGTLILSVTGFVQFAYLIIVSCAAAACLIVYLLLAFKEATKM